MLDVPFGIPELNHRKQFEIQHNKSLMFASKAQRAVMKTKTGEYVNYPIMSVHTELGVKG